MSQILRAVENRLLGLEKKSEIFLKGIDKSASPWQLEQREKYKNNFGKFFVDAWDYAGTGDALIPDLAQGALCYHIEAWLAREFKTLLIAMPARMSKSTITEVILPAYVWTYFARAHFLTTSYSHNYAMRDNMYMQKLIKSDWYQSIWGNEFQLLITNRERTTNSSGGQRVATSILGQNTGAGGNYIINDDLNNLTKKASMANSEKINDTVADVMIHRQNNADTTQYLFGQHRSGNNDVIAKWMSKNDGSSMYLELAMEYEIKRRHVSIHPRTGEIFWEDPRKIEGELLAPKRYTPEAIKFAKLRMSTAMYGAIFQQNPINAETSVFREDWFKKWQEPFYPEFKMIIQSWDTAVSKKIDACYSACVTYGIFEDKNKNVCVMILSVFTGQLEFTDLRSMMIRLAKNYEDTDFENPIKGSNKPDLILVEEMSSGTALIDSLKKIGINTVGYRPPRRTFRGAMNEEAKVARARIVSQHVESGRIFLMTKAPYFDELLPESKIFLKACVEFPSSQGATKDIVDTFSQVLDWLQQRNWIKSHEQVMHELFGVNELGRKNFNLKEITNKYD